jgi:DNA-binding protein YbaB
MDEPVTDQQDAQQAAERMWEAARAAGTRTVEEFSPDGEVHVVATLHGQITNLVIRPDALRSLDRESLAELITRTLRTAQQHARACYHADITATTPPHWQPDTTT